MTQEGEKTAPTAEAEVLEDGEDEPISEQPAETVKSPPVIADTTDKETEKPKSSSKVEHCSKPTGKMVMCRITLLDGSTIEIELDKGAKAQVLFDKVCAQLKLEEVEYFGLTYLDKDIKYWLTGDKKIAKQLKAGCRWVFDFAVKFYPPEPSQLTDDITRYHLCLQVRVDLYNGRLPCSQVTHSLLGSYTVQAELGDYDPVDCEPGYLENFDFAQQQNKDLLKKIHELHKTHKGQSPEEAEGLFLENAKKLAMYGVDLHKAKDSEKTEISLGVCSSGLMVFKDKLRMNRFVWPKILKLSYKRDNFYIKIRPTEQDSFENMICFKLANHKMAKRLWKTCVEHHTFFRLKESEPPKVGTLFPRFNSKFRYSGRTQKQLKDRTDLVERPKPEFERTHFKNKSMPYPESKTTRLDDSDDYSKKNSDHPLDENDRMDKKYGDNDPTANAGPPPYSSRELDEHGQRAPGDESHADRPNRPPGDESEDRLDQEKDKAATMTAPDGSADVTELDAGVGLTNVGRKSKRSREEKEREKREKEEEKKRKKEEEKERKRLEKERKKKEKEGNKSTSEDRTDKLGEGVATEDAPGDSYGDAATLPRETNTKGAEDQGSSVDPAPIESHRDSDNKNERKKEVKFLDQCTLMEAETTKVVKEETPITSPTIIISAAPPQPEEEEEQVVMEVVKETETEVTIGDDVKVTDQEIVKETDIIVGEIKEETKVEVQEEPTAVVVANVKKSEHIIPDENIEDEVFESETEHAQKIQAELVTKEDAVPSKEAMVSMDVQVTTDQIVVAETRDEEQTVPVAEQESPAETEVAVSPEVCVEAVEVSPVEEPIVLEKSSSVEVQPDPKVTEVVESVVETVVPVKSPPHNPVEPVQQQDDPPVQQQSQEVVLTADEDIHEVVKGEIILPVVVTNEEAENQPKDQAEAGPSSEVEHKEEEVKVDKNELKKQEKERKQKEKERIKKEKEEKKREKEEQKRLEKERKKKEKEEKEEQKRLEKEKKKKEKEEKKAKVDVAVTEEEDKGEKNEEDEKEETEVKVDPVQIELAAALEQRRGKEEEVTEDKEEKNEHTEDQASAVTATATSEVVAEEKVQETKNEKEEVEIVTETKKDKKSKKEKKKKKEKPKKEDKKRDSTTGCFSFMGAKKADSDQEEVEEAPAEEMPTEPWVTVEQQEPEEPKPEETEVANVSPKQRGVGLGWALPGFAEMKERQAAAAAKPVENDKPRSMSTSSAKSSSSPSASSSEGEHFPHEPRAPLAEFSEGLSTEGGLDAGGDDSLGSWPYGKEGSIDRRMQFMPVTAPSTEEQSETRQKKSSEDTSMPFFDPASATNDSEGEGTLGKKVPPPVAPKSARLSQMAEEERQRQKEEEDRRLQLEEEERLASLPPTVATESRKYDPETEEIPIPTTNVPIVKTETRTVTYEKDGVPVAIEDITLISSQSHSTRTQLSETTTYRAETNGIVETRMEKKVIITEDGDDDIDHDALLAAAIRSVTDMDPNLSVERIEYTKQVDNPSGDTQV